MRGRDIDEGRRARPAVQILVRAADGEIRIGAGHIDRKRARRMGEIPDDERAHAHAPCGQRRHVMPAAGAIIDLGHHHRRDRRIDRIRHRFGRDDPQLMSATQRFQQPFRHVEIGREIAAVGQDDGAIRIEIERGGQRLIDLDRQRIAHHHAAGRRTDQPAHPVTNAARHRHPAGIVPGADQPAAPFAPDRLGEALLNPARQRPERIAVEINHPRGQIEQRARRPEISHHSRSAEPSRSQPDARRSCSRWYRRTRQAGRRDFLKGDRQRAPTKQSS